MTPPTVQFIPAAGAEATVWSGVTDATFSFGTIDNDPTGLGPDNGLVDEVGFREGSNNGLNLFLASGIVHADFLSAFTSGTWSITYDGNTASATSVTYDVDTADRIKINPDQWDDWSGLGVTATTGITYEVTYTP